MSLPFASEEFLAVFARYNERVWPLQVILVAAAFAATAIAARPSSRRDSSRAIAAVLAFFWLWMGVVYHIGFFRAINPAAVAFGVAFIAESAFFVGYGVLGDRLRIRFVGDTRGWLGAALVVYALAVYPLLSTLIGHRYPEAPTFGLPCPTTIFTLGLLSWTRPSVPWPLTIVPIGWAIIGSSAAVRLGMWEDLGLGIGAMLFLVTHVGIQRSHRIAMR